MAIKNENIRIKDTNGEQNRILQNVAWQTAQPTIHERRFEKIPTKIH